MPHRGLSLFLALALLLFSWAELDHVSDLDAHQGDDCAYCLFTGALDNGAAPAPLLAPSRPVSHSAPLRSQTVSVLPQPYRHTLGQRGPPTLS